MTISGGISGSAGLLPLSKLGPGTVILTAANSYNGTLAHNDGTVIVNGSFAGGVTMYSSSTTTTTLAGTGNDQRTGCRFLFHKHRSRRYRGRRVGGHAYFWKQSLARVGRKR